MYDEWVERERMCVCARCQPSPIAAFPGAPWSPVRVPLFSAASSACLPLNIVHTALAAALAMPLAAAPACRIAFATRPPTGRGRGHPGDGGVRPEMGPDLGVRGGAPGKILALRVHFQAQTACGGMMWLSAKHKVRRA